tara:strand:- start:2258 stop:3331 length:1074 start_codon:yes stop_codon:yes gene_type:complete
MSNHKFIQVYPPKEELPLPIPANFFEFGFFVENKSKSILVLTVTSPTSTFSTVTPGDFIEFSSTDPVTLLETVIGTMEVATFNTDGARTMVESIPLDSTLESTTKFIDNTGRFRRPNIIPKLYKLPTNNFSLQVKTDSIVRYYEDPVDKTIMYLDLIESGSVCSITGNTNIVTYGEFQDYGGSTLALTTSYTDWTSGAAGLSSNITMTTSPNKFTIITPGTYKLEGSFSISSSAANKDITLAISKNGAVLPETENERHFQSAGSGGSVSIVDLIEVAVGDEITLSVKADAATTMTINNISLNIKLLEDTGGASACSDVWEHDRASLGIVTLNNTDKLPCHNIVPYLNSIFLGADDEN